MANYAPQRNTYDSSDRRWLPNMLKADTHGVTLDGSKFTAGVVPSGTFIGIVTTGGLGAPYVDANTDGTETAVGILLNDVKVAAGEKHHVAVVHGGTVDRRYLPSGSGHDTAAEADLSAIAFIH